MRNSTPFTTGGSRSALFGLANLGGGNAWAVGGTSDLTGFQPARPIAMHWNGTAWSLSWHGSSGTADDDVPPV